jgi:16S rRNA (uracil1498-N3)-methyltransferase
MHRFFVPRSVLQGSDVKLAGEVARQISRVLRMRPGDVVVLLDGSGYEHSVRLEEFGADTVRGTLLKKEPGRGEASHMVDLYLSLLNKPDKFEWALQKCTELGVARVVPVVAERSVARAFDSGRRERYERIMREAAEQSGRARFPELDEAMLFADAVALEEKRLVEDGEALHLALILALGADTPIAEALWEHDQLGSVSVFIGPEGGFSDDELALADRAGIRLVSLGPRTLRAETSAVSVLTIVMYELGDMGGRM